MSDHVLLWCDLETAGTDERRDPILEIAAILTDSDLRELATFEVVVKPDLDVEDLRSAAGDVVRVMHDENGLWEECADGRPILWAEQDLIRLITYHSPEKKVRLAGSGVGHFDRRFIRHQMPSLDTHLDHAPFDVGQVRRFCELANPPLLARVTERSARRGRAHRAMSDIRSHLEEARLYVDLIRQIPVLEAE